MQMLLRKEDIRDSLGISLATVNNWIKTSIIPAPDYGDRYTENTYNEIVKKIKKGSIKLNGRANRSQIDTKYITYLGIKDKNRKHLLEQIIERFEGSGLSIHEGVIALAISMLKYNNLFIEGSIVYKKVLTWIEDISSSLTKLSIFSDFTILNMDDDFIGAFYQSIQSISAKSITGSYYTPSELLTTIKIEKNKSVIDPCCGSGGILLKVLSKNHNPSFVYARDIDAIALQICTVNLVLFFNDPNMTANISYHDFLFGEDNGLFSELYKEKYDYIVTNPPWGSKFSKKQKDLLVSLYPEISTTEAFGIALYKASKMISEEGELYFFLPHSFLNVSTHKNIRKHILNSIPQIEIKLLGNAFKGVLSEAILLSLKRHDNAKRVIEVEDKKGKRYCLDRANMVSPDYIITATSSNIDEEILGKIFGSNYSTLLGIADFALGIVTGNNKEHIFERSTNKSEPIFRGKDIDSYKFLEPTCFIEFKPEIYQQVAPLKYFRTKKIVYRFISDKIICAIDDNNSLVLNSANLFIPHSYPMETIVCLFNSDIYSFIYRKRYHSTKVLKSHLQSMPLPIFSEEDHLKFKQFYTKICSGNMKQEDIDLEICKYFGLTSEDYRYIKESINGTT
jgi:16S rRNA G966 N2-methylase RsmD